MVGSHEFYLGYAVANRKLLCLDAGHFHPTETIADKISSVLMYLDEILLHVSRGVRWDSDHVVILSDDLRATAEEIVRGGFLDRVHIGLDFFDASINRVAAWVTGTRAMLKALLLALLEPTAKLREFEIERRFHLAVGPGRGDQDAAVRRGLGLLLPAAGRAGGHGVDGGYEAVREGSDEATMKKRVGSLIPVERIERAILLIRGQKVMLDRDLAALYGVKAIALCQQVARNRARFPRDFMFRLTEEEVGALVSQNVIPSRRNLGGSLPYTFTRMGVPVAIGG